MNRVAAPADDTEVSPHANPPSAETVAALVEAYQETGIPALAREHRMANRTVRAILVAAGVEIRKRGTRGAPRPSPETVAALVEGYQQGYGLVALGERHQLGPRRVRAILVGQAVEIRKFGDSHTAPPRAPRAPLPAEVVAEMAAAYEAGAGLAPIGKRFACSPQTVRAALIGAGVEIRKPGIRPTRPGPRAALDVEEMVERFTAGCTVAQVAAEAGVARSTVSRMVVAATGRSPGSLNQAAKEAARAAARAGRRVFSEEEVAEIVAAFRDGVSMPALAERFCTSLYFIDKMLTEAGLPPGGRRPQQGWNNLRRSMSAEEMVDLLRAGVLRDEVARRAGVTPGRVSQLVLAATGKSPKQVRAESGTPTRSLSAEQVAELQEVWRNDPTLSVREVSERFGVSHYTVRKVLHEDLAGDVMAMRAPLGGRRVDQIVVLIEAYLSCTSAQQAAAVARVGSKQTVLDALTAVGVPRHSRSSTARRVPADVIAEVSAIYRESQPWEIAVPVPLATQDRIRALLAEAA